jgi:hypothetical protein
MTMRVSRCLAFGLLALIFLPALTHAQSRGGQLPPATLADSLQRSLETQALMRFGQAGVELTIPARRQLEAIIAHGVNRLRLDTPTAGRVADARQNLNRLVDRMIRDARAAGGTVVDSALVMKPCRPPVYPYCP